MTVQKTRAKLVDVARQLFAKKGVEETTMNDIAVASKKGRRTLYTYFKSRFTWPLWSLSWNFFRTR
jgi:AcrR family transcriptional regulator